MSDEVKFIFKTLMKVPIIIIVSFLILNMFAFFFIYFKVLGLSYVVMQTAVENNYLPKSECTTLCRYVAEFEKIPMVTNTAIIVAQNGSDYVLVQSEDDLTTVINDSQNDQDSIGKTYSTISLDSGMAGTALKKMQYGNTITVGVHCGYKLVWPLGYKETIQGVDVGKEDDINSKGVDGYNGSGFSGFKSEDKLTSDREDKATLINFDICHTVPGLKYYPDLLQSSAGH